MKKAKAKKAKAPKAKTKKTRKGKKAKARAMAKKASVAGGGCCTIVFDDGREDEQVEGISKAECTREGRRRGGVGQWNKGACA
ncbi:hypothetical protein [Bradyrhizobium ivorense]|uniref:hypothetical protein n=1 Tax=Bradyrhizobium ivorense TaxID=2511166 RepID=UPI0011160206|nr:hypothetical protein [Bradyrhizobium ivorense]MCC8938017.1 hypothetical protein [Bradyrhizobium ivorense]